MMEVVGGVNDNKFYIRILQDFIIGSDDPGTRMFAGGITSVSFKDQFDPVSRMCFQQRTVEDYPGHPIRTDGCVYWLHGLD
jgi:hypothetical protein